MCSGEGQREEGAGGEWRQAKEEKMRTSVIMSTIQIKKTKIRQNPSLSSYHGKCDKLKDVINILLFDKNQNDSMCL